MEQEKQSMHGVHVQVKPTSFTVRHDHVELIRQEQLAEFNRTKKPVTASAVLRGILDKYFGIEEK